MKVYSREIKTDESSRESINRFDVATRLKKTEMEFRMENIALPHVCPFAYSQLVAQCMYNGLYWEPGDDWTSEHVEAR